MSSAQDTEARGYKRMRKGTKSCLYCRRRKTRCDGERPCGVCRAQGAVCIEQGIVPTDVDAQNLELRERVAQLESQLEQLSRDDNRADQFLPLPHQAANHALDGLLGTLHCAAGSNQHDGLFNGHLRRHDLADAAQVEQPVDSEVAPVVQLMQNPVFGGTPETQSNARSPLQQPPSQEEYSANLPKSSRNLNAVRDLCSYLPSKAEMAKIFQDQSSWWPLYRESLGLVWGDDCATLQLFATQAFKEAHPPMLALLLISFAISTGEHERYLPPVERHIVNDEEFAGTEYGLNCLMALGICYLYALKPRRAWTVYRRANTLLQLHGLHRRHRGNEKRDLLFWQLMHADRWVSLMVGLPYSSPTNLYDMDIAPLAEISPGVWIYRQLAVITGRVIDHLQGIGGPNLSIALAIEEQIETACLELPRDYLSFQDIRACSDFRERCTRLYRVVHVHQLKGYLHLPFFLRSAEESRFGYSRVRCIEDAEILLDAYIALFDLDPAMVSSGGTLNLTAFTAAIIVLLSLLGYGRPATQALRHSTLQQEQASNRVYRTLDALKYGSQCDISRLHCQDCFTALESLILNAQASDRPPRTRVVLPYFGTILVERNKAVDTAGRVDDGISQPTSPNLSQHHTKDGQRFSQQTSDRGAAESARPDFPPVPGINNASQPAFDLDMTLAYQGPFLPPSHGSWPPNMDASGSEMNWVNDQGFEADWDWLNADLPPNGALQG